MCLSTGPGAETDAKVRAFVPDRGIPEDPGTGSPNAGLAQSRCRLHRAT